MELEGAPEGRGSVIVCGLQPLGIQIVQQLHHSGTHVVVVDDDPDRRLVPVLEGWNVPFVLGSPRQPSVMIGVGVMAATAVICVEDDDLRSLESALLAHDLRPDLRVVAQIANPSVASALRSVIGDPMVLDVATLASPSLVQACRNEPVHDLPIEGVEFVAAEAECRDEGSLRDLYGDLVPLAVVPAGSTEVEVCPGRDFRVSAGDKVTMLGTPDDLARVGIERATALRGGASRRLGRDRIATLRRMWPEFPGPLRLVLLAIVALVLLSTTVLAITYRRAGGAHLGVVDSLYFTVVTISTVGYGDFSFANQVVWLRLFAVVLIVTGVALATTLFALITSTLFSRSLANALGRQRITRMRGHVVIVGLGAIGVRVVEGLLARGVPVAAIERDERNRHLARVRALGVPILFGDATETSTLDAANTQAASAVAALTSDDLTNVETGLVLREYLRDADAHQTPTVLRIFDRQLSLGIERHFSFRAVRSTAALAAPWFLGAALGLGILSTFYVGDELFLVASLTVGPAGGLVGLPMNELSARIRVVAISRGPDHTGLQHPVRREARFAPDDRAYLVGPYEELLLVLRRDSQTAVSGPTAEPQLP
jgi:Trk K+ transport system NAD-binding subunit